LSLNQLPIASSVAGEAKFSLAINFSLLRWSRSSCMIAAATSGSSRATLSSAAANATVSWDSVPGA